MLKSGFVLSSDHHLQVAMHNKLPVTVWMGGSILDYGGQIERITDHAVCINGEYYLKATCRFVVR